MAVVVPIAFASAFMIAAVIWASTISQAKQLLGTWRLVAAESRSDLRSNWSADYGPHPKGYFVYDRTGHFSLQFCGNTRRAVFASRNDFTPTPGEAKEVYLNYVAYFGTFSLDVEPT
jgi:hypothetical protein